jgi:hypothetical protein
VTTCGAAVAFGAMCERLWFPTFSGCEKVEPHGDHPRKCNHIVLTWIREMKNIPIVTFDTSAHNRLAPKDGPLAESVLAKIKSEMFIRFAGISIDELYATTDSARRATLLGACRRLQQGEGDCIYPQDQVLKLLIEAHVKDPGHFDWTAVEVVSGEYMHEISAGEWINDEDLITEHRNNLRARLKGFECIFKSLPLGLQHAFESNGEAPPTTYREFLGFLKSDKKLMGGICKGIYDRVAGTDVSKDVFLEFLDVCPPFRAFNYAIDMSHYDRLVRNEDGERFKSGCNDLLMAIYLPYCNRFVTADRMQEKCLREIASVSGLGTEVVFYDDFYDSIN